MMYKHHSITQMYNTNNNGPIIEPCGTPDATGECDDALPFIFRD